MNFPHLESQRLMLDELSAADEHAIFEIFSNDEVTKYYDLEAFNEIDQAENLINFFRTRYNDKLGIRWAIRRKSDKQCIGTCGFNSWQIPFRSAVIGYDLHRHYWGQGIITEALGLILRSAFNDELVCKNINRIQADTIPGNIASEKVLKKLSFKEEGIRRQAGYWKNRYHDLKCFSLLKDEFTL